MAARIDRIRVLILGLAIVLAAVLAYLLAEKRPEKGITMTPKQYIERVEELKRERIEQARKAQQQESTSQPSETR